MKSIFDEEAYEEILSRLEALTETCQGEWGKMSASQMLKHCQHPLNLALGHLQLKKPNIFKRLIFSTFKTSLYNDKPWKRNLPTVKEFRVDEPKDFFKEKSKLLELVKAFHQEKTKSNWDTHPIFGSFTAQQWGQIQYKHLDHHLGQFGV